MGRSIVGATHLIKYKRKPRKTPIPQAYQKRNDRLSDLGLTYQQYLETPEWKAIRARVLLEGTSCLVCNRLASQVHHTDYEWDTLLGTRLKSLAPLCRECHESIEFDNGEKNTLDKANAKLVALVAFNKAEAAVQWLAGFRAGRNIDGVLDSRRRKREWKTRKKWMEGKRAAKPRQIAKQQVKQREN